MRNLKLTIEYEGTDYFGWQTQKRCHYKTIQETIEKVLSKVLQEKIRLIAAGRTDTGVHAIAQVANFKTHSKLPLNKIQRALNGLLPTDIAIKDIKEVPLNFHSRYNTKTKTYRYIILQGPQRISIDRNYFYYLPYKLNINKIRSASKFLIGRHNFNAFCASGSSVKNTTRTIKRISVKVSKNTFLYKLPPESYFLIFDIEADGFLYNMVRNIVGTLIEVGRGKLSPYKIKTILASKNRKNAGPTTPSTGLTLLKINY